MNIMDTEELVEILKKAEIKRVKERLTKKEICNIFGFNYNFYMNCVSDRNKPSKKMGEQLSEYLETPTIEVYKMVFASREPETEFHKNLHITDEEVDALVKELTNSKKLTEPQVQAL